MPVHSPLQGSLPKSFEVCWAMLLYLIHFGCHVCCMQGGIVVDEQYRALSRVRSEQAGQAARSVQVFEHTRKSTLEVLRAKRSHQVERLKVSGWG
jgi:hypothetical protein